MTTSVVAPPTPCFLPLTNHRPGCKKRFVKVARYDSGKLDKATRTPSGGIKVPATITRIGVLRYRMADGSERFELRPPEEVFAADSLSSLAHAPVTDGHKGRVTPENWKAVAIGHVGENVTHNDSHVSANLVIDDLGGIGAIDSGERKDLSAGYYCEFDPTPGVFNGERYDGIQREIRYNHVAILPVGTGRAGPSATLHLDANDACEVHSEPSNRLEPTPMKTIRIDGQDYEIGSDAHFAKLDAMHKAELAKVRAEADTATGRADSADKTIATLRAELAAAKDPKVIQDAANVRARVIVQARKVLGQRFDDTGKTPTDMIVAMLTKMDPSFDPKGKSDDYIMGAFAAMFAAKFSSDPEEAPEGAPEGAPAPGVAHDSIHGARAGLNGKAPTDPTPNAAKSLDAMRNDARDAYKRPLRMSLDAK